MYGHHTPLGLRLSLGDFLCLDGPLGEPARPGDEKATFMTRLGLNEHCQQHITIFAQMQKDARQSRDSLCYDPKALLAELEGVSSIKPPYLLPQIREDVFLAAIRDIYRKANCETQSIYALVGTEEDNWVIRWMLWNVIDELDPGSNQFQPTSHRLKSAPTPLPTSGISINNRKEKVSVDAMSSLHELFDFKHNQRPYYRCSRPRSSRKRSSLLPDYTRVWAPYPAPSSNKSYWDPVRDT